MYTNSPLATYIDLSPGNYGARQSVKGITIHHMAGNMTVQQCGALFHRKKGNSNYGIDSKGTCALYVEEKNGAWTSNSKENDLNMITIEVANNGRDPYWPISNEAYMALIELCADICRRNNISRLIWSNNKNERINHINGANMTMHCDFWATACPGYTLKTLMPSIANDVNMKLSGMSKYIIFGYDYSPVFDPEYYANRYADLKEAFGLNSDALWLHFQMFGMNELRQASANFDPVFYKNNYPDLLQAFQDDNPMYYYHYCACGIEEGRDGKA